MTGAISITGLGKAYRRYPSGWARLAEWLYPGRPRHQQNWVLRGLDAEIAPGAAVGIIGRNGAGKSTLLKLITGTCFPTEGAIEISGRVAALLELGMGFHPDITGRQNVRIAAQLQGLSPTEIDDALPQIEAFAEIGPYLDQPVRTYSSGMQVRLAFSTATALRPDVLIVDEALAVGDIYFQHKCFARIREFRRQGTTLLFVSHDPGAIKSLCDRALLLDAGRIIADDTPDQVLDLYNALVAEREQPGYGVTAAPAGNLARGVRSGDQRVRLLQAELYRAGSPAQIFRVGEPMQLCFTLQKSVPVDELTAGFVIRDRVGNEVFGTNTWHVPAPGLEELAVGEQAQLCWQIPALRIRPGSYTVSVALHGQSTHVDNSYDWWDRAALFEVVAGDEPAFDGLCHLCGVSATLVRPGLERPDEERAQVSSTQASSRE